MKSGWVTAVLIGLWAVGEATAATYYVDKATGSDTRTGLSTSAAWATIGKANATLRAGDTVFIRAGTYDEIIEPYQSGASGAPITYKNYPGETVLLRGKAGKSSLVAIGRPFFGPSGPRSYIIVDGFRLRHIDPFNMTYDAWAGGTPSVRLVYILGDGSRFNVIRNCRIEGQGRAVWGGGIETGVLIHYAHYNTLENNHISGLCRLGVHLAGGARFNLVRGNSILNCYKSSIDFESGKGVMQGNLIEGNWLDGTLVEDGIQFENNYDLPSGTIDYDSNRGVMIRNNVISNSAENAIDLKGGAYITIENNVFYGTVGNNDGGLRPGYGDLRYPGALTIIHGDGTGSRDVILRGNVLYDGDGGIYVDTGYKVYNNTLLYNNRDYTGTNSSWGGALSKPSFVGLQVWMGKARVSIKNNICGGHNAADVAMGRGGAGLEIDNNLYFNDSGARLVDFRAKADWSYVPFSQWPPFLASQGIVGADSHTLQTAPLLVNAPADLTGPHTQFDFSLRAGSPAIDRGAFLTKTTAAGQGTSIPVKDAGFFCTGYGIVGGDVIQLAGQSATARIVSISSNTLVVDRALTWSAGQGVSLPYNGSAPDIGAREYGGSPSTGYALQVSATNGSVTKDPDKTGYSAGETVTLQATPNAGYTFTGWSGDLTGTANPATLTMDSNKSVIANFAAITYTLTVSATSGSVTTTPSKTGYAAGETVTLQATPSTGYVFTGWSGDLTGTTNPATLTMDANKSVIASFAAITYTLTVSATNGSVTTTPSKTGYAAGETVTLQATPSAGYVFVGWSGDLTGTSNPAPLTMDANKSVTANFAGASATFTLLITATNGSVARTPDKAGYSPGETVTLQATPNADYTFVGWSGGLTGTTNPATLVMDANKSVSAGFTAAVKGTAYYVDRAAGNDNNDGKSPATAWRFLAKVNSYTGFAPGDRILLHRGHLWREQLIVPVSGTADKPIVIGTYDTGVRPLLKGSALVRSWTGAGTANKWQAALSTQPNQVFFDGVRGTMKADLAGLSATLDWCWVSGVLYVYAASDPDGLYAGPGIEASVRPARANGLIQIQGRQYVTVEGLEVAQSSGAGIYISGPGQHLTIKDCDVNHSLDGGLVATAGGASLAQLTVQDCLIHHNNGGVMEGALGVATYDEGLTVHGVDGFTVRGCRIHSNHALGVSLKRGARNGVVEKCQVYSNRLLNVYLDGASNVKIRYNKLYDCGWDAGIKFGVETSTYHNDTIEVHSNLFWDNGNGISFTGAGGVTTQTRNLSVHNNTFYNNSWAIRWKSTAAGHYGGTNSIRNNILWAQAASNTGLRDETRNQEGLAATTIAYNAFQEAAPSDTTGTNAVVVAEARFVDPSTRDFHLRAGSACVDAGTDVGLTADFEGTPVPQGSAPDLGAYESASAVAYTLTVNATNGSVTKSPDKAGYSAAETVSLTATANAGYVFTGWSGDLTGTTNPATLTMDANKSVTANFAAITCSLNVSAANGSVTATPSKTSYAFGETVTLQATSNAGYVFTGWSGDLTGTANPATLTMDANKSVTANFAAITCSLNVSAANGSVTATPSKTSYAFGETVTLEAMPNTGYTLAGWSGDLTGTTNPATLVMDSNKSVTASFVAQTYTLSVSATNGTVTKTPDQASYAYGETVTLQAVPDPNYVFSGWSGDLTGTTNPATLTMDSHKSVAASCTSRPADRLPPELGNCSPVPDTIQVPPNTLVTLHLSDAGEGVEAASVSLRVNGDLVYAGDMDSQRTDSGVCRRVGTKADYTYAYQPHNLLGYDREVSVTVNARDLAGNVMPGQTYSFTTEMYSFGVNRAITEDQYDLAQGRPTTVSDSRGNVWVAWHAGNVGSRHIYAARFRPELDSYSSTVRVSQSAGDHCNPTMAIDSLGILYVAWQENAGGAWNVCVSTSADGKVWSLPKPIVAATRAPAVNRTSPVLAAGRSPSSLVALAWQEDRSGNQDIGLATSSTRFLTATVAQVTSDPADQTQPVLALDSQDTVVVLWTDARNGATDLYGAASDNGPWTNVAVVTGAGNQSHPTVAAATTGRTLHLAWVDDATGDLEVLYATSDGLPAGPLAGAGSSLAPGPEGPSGAGLRVADDTSGADQQAPVVRVATRSDGTDCVYIAWQDGRNLAVSGDTDVYFAEVGTGPGPEGRSAAGRTNVLVDDDGTGVDQQDVVLGVDASGYPYVLWADDVTGILQLYHAGATYASPVPLAEGEIQASVGGVVGIPPNRIKSLDNVSVVIPPLACPFDVTIDIARICNPQGFATESLRHYEFGPSGLTFVQPVTITIPYNARGTSGIKVYWFDSVTAAFSSDGVTDVQDLSVGRGLRALQFKTTHFTPFYLLSADSAEAANQARGRLRKAHSQSEPDTWADRFHQVRRRVFESRHAPAPTRD